MARPRGGFSKFSTCTFCLNRATQRIHEVDDLGRFALLWRFNFLTGLLLLQQILQGFLVSVLESFRFKVRLLGLHDVLRQVEQLPWPSLGPGLQIDHKCAMAGFQKRTISGPSAGTTRCVLDGR